MRLVGLFVKGDTIVCVPCGSDAATIQLNMPRIALLTLPSRSGRDYAE